MLFSCSVMCLIIHSRMSRMILKNIKIQEAHMRECIIPERRHLMMSPNKMSGNVFYTVNIRLCKFAQ